MLEQNIPCLGDRNPDYLIYIFLIFSDQKKTNKLINSCKPNEMLFNVELILKVSYKHFDNFIPILFLAYNESF